MDIQKKRFKALSRLIASFPITDSIQLGRYRNVTRDQVINVVEINGKLAHYVWEDDPTGRQTYSKSIEHILRSYKKI